MYMYVPMHTRMYAVHIHIGISLLHAVYVCRPAHIFIHIHVRMCVQLCMYVGLCLLCINQPIIYCHEFAFPLPVGQLYRGHS